MTVKPFLPAGNLALVVPTMSRPLVEEETNGPVIKSNSSSLDTIASQEEELSEEQIAWINAAGYFLDVTLKPSKSQGIQNMRILLTCGRKLFPKYFKGEEFDARTVAKATLEVAAKRAIIKALSNIPYVAVGIGVSQLAEILKAPLQNWIQSEYTRNQQEWSGTRPWNMGLREIRLVATSGAIEVASWPIHKLDAFLQKRINAVVDSTFSVGEEVIEGYGEAFREATKFFTNPIFFPRIASMLDKMKDAFKNEQEEEANPIPWRRESGQDRYEDYELLDQFMADQELLDDFVNEAGKQNQAQATKSLSLNSPADLTAYKSPNPIERNPIADVMGGSFSVRGGSRTRPKYSAQINFTLGPKDLPSVHAPRGYVPPDQTGASCGITTYPPGHNPFWKPIDKELDLLDKNFAKYKAEVEKLQAVQKEGEGKEGESPETIIERSNRVIACVYNLNQLTNDVMADAWRVHMLTCKDAVRETNFNKKTTALHAIESTAK